jgi:hypothetical protein
MAKDAWSPGDHIVYREVTHGKVWTARPVTVIQDTPDLVALYFRNNTVWKVCTPPNAFTSLIQCKANLSEWDIVDATWQLGETLFLIVPGEAHATHLMRNAAGTFMGWYVNLQEPLRRTQIGFDFLDQELDVVVHPSGEWRWKDREHLKEAEEVGFLTPDGTRAIQTEAQRVIRRIKTKATPFDGSWNAWQAPSEWTAPVLRDGWDRVEV